jgi:hypothetical protein
MRSAGGGCWIWGQQVEENDERENRTEMVKYWPLDILVMARGKGYPRLTFIFQNHWLQIYNFSSMHVCCTGTPNQCLKTKSFLKHFSSSFLM